MKGYKEGFHTEDGRPRQRQKCLHIEVRLLKKDKEEEEVALTGGEKDMRDHFSQRQEKSI